MIENDIVFVTTTLYTKWLNYQTDIIKRLFPNSQIIHVDGRSNWPNSWFYWIEEVKKTNAKYYIHIDEDFFILNREEIIKIIQKLESNEADLIGCPDGYHQFRGANPVAMNTLILFGKTEHLKNVNFTNIQFAYSGNGWINNMGLHYKSTYEKDFKYTFTKNGGSNFNFEQEPYYAFLWAMKELNLKFDYLYPHFDETLKSTNPRINETSPDIGIHMWYTRQWNSDMDVHGLPNIERYNKVEEFLKK
jgi:hypothetical protein